ncbi:MAG: SH3 domain-containing protein [Gemmatimonadaceae bacterium]
MNLTSRRTTGLRYLILLPAVLVVSIACASANGKKPASGGKANNGKNRVVYDTVLVKDPELERRFAMLELKLLEKEAQVEDLEVRLVDTRTAVVRAMARAQTATSRAEAASGMAEAEVALQSLRASGQAAAEAMQVNHLVRQSSLEFDRKNYGGALYLANQAKALATSYRARASAASRETARPDETAFALPIRVKVETNGNIREGPGTNFGIAFGVESGSVLTAFSYTQDWIRVNDEKGRNGWIYRGLVGRP